MPPQHSSAPTTTIASYPTYADAHVTATYLYGRGIAVGNLSIVGAGLRQLEQPAAGATRRLTLAGAGNGAWLGALVGGLIAVFATSPNSALTVVLWSILYGVLFGTLRGFLQGLAHGRPGAHRWEVVEATRYEVLCVTADASVARQLLAGYGGVQSGTAAPVVAPGPVGQDARPTGPATDDRDKDSEAA